MGMRPEDWRKCEEAGFDIARSAKKFFVQLRKFGFRRSEAIKIVQAMIAGLFRGIHQD